MNDRSHAARLYIVPVSMNVRSIILYLLFEPVNSTKTFWINSYPVNSYDVSIEPVLFDFRTLSRYFLANFGVLVGVHARFAFNMEFAHLAQESAGAYELIRDFF